MLNVINSPNESKPNNHEKWSERRKAKCITQKSIAHASNFRCDIFVVVVVVNITMPQFCTNVLIAG